jgi:hypothetical protein
MKCNGKRWGRSVMSDPDLSVGSPNDIDHENEIAAKQWRIRPMTIKPLFAWYDLWVGVFWDAAKRKLYVLPLPCIGIVIQFGPKP